MAESWSIEVLHGETSAFPWQQQHDSTLIEAALTNGALDGKWHADSWGVAFEVLFDTAEQWETFRSLPAVRAALDGVPDPVNGLIIYRGRGGSSGSGNHAGHARLRAQVPYRCPNPKATSFWMSPASPLAASSGPDIPASGPRRVTRSMLCCDGVRAPACRFRSIPA